MLLPPVAGLGALFPLFFLRTVACTCFLGVTFAVDQIRRPEEQRKVDFQWPFFVVVAKEEVARRGEDMCEAVAHSCDGDVKYADRSSHYSIGFIGITDSTFNFLCICGGGLEKWQTAQNANR